MRSRLYYRTPYASLNVAASLQSGRSAPTSSACISAGSGDSKRMCRAADRVDETEARRVQRLARERRQRAAPAGARRRCRRPADGRRRPGAPGSGGCARSPAGTRPAPPRSSGRTAPAPAPASPPACRSRSAPPSACGRPDAGRSRPRSAARRPAPRLTPARSGEPRLGRVGRAVGHREVAPLEVVGGELRARAPVGGVGLRDHQQARGVLVDAVDDARAAAARRSPTACRRSGAAARSPACRRGAPGRGMHDEARRLVDDDEIGVLVDDVERDRLGRGRGSASAAAGVTTTSVPGASCSRGSSSTAPVGAAPPRPRRSAPAAASG